MSDNEFILKALQDVFLYGLPQTTDFERIGKIMYALCDGGYTDLIVSTENDLSFKYHITDAGIELMDELKEYIEHY
ncbi:hypothetical protein AB4G91_06800 [Macrococcoides goetzii]|uniref:hypothetical protein n=1 Tax=Macrococcus sp. PK TaxID=2801919 RepID=UPI001F0FEC3A|nr:hypothetical protein [Macrococcus sp. PK]MCH4984925.1 hypothetical protein [Macrococcus sp. PK]